MSYYLFPVDNRAITSKSFYQLHEHLTIHYYSHITVNFFIGDYLLIAQQNENLLLPYLFEIEKINKDAQELIIRVAQVYNCSLPLQPVLSLIYMGYGEKHASDSSGYDKILPSTFEVISSFMSSSSNSNNPHSIHNNIRIEQIAKNISTNVEPVTLEEDEEDEIIFKEEEVLDYVKDHIRNRGYYFPDEMLYNYHICQKTRPFVILAGLSGTGKSKLARLYAEALGHIKHFQRLSVRPNWNDDRYLLGHFNSLTGEYVTETALEFIFDAIKYQKNIYSICLDEMNLAHVEYYFSQFLSAMEEEISEERRITLLSKQAYKQIQQSQNIPREIYLPDNLLFPGTINVDETTQPISDKVIDRANTIEFFHVDLNQIPERKSVIGDPIVISAKAWLSYRATQPDTSYHAAIIEVNDILKEANLGIGYRVVREIEMYIANSNNILPQQVAFDLQLKQRILPRVRGTERIKNTLKKLIAFSHTNKFERTEERLKEMQSRLEYDGYTSFWR